MGDLRSSIARDFFDGPETAYDDSDAKQPGIQGAAYPRAKQLNPQENLIASQEHEEKCTFEEYERSRNRLKIVKENPWFAEVLQAFNNGAEIKKGE